MLIMRYVERTWEFIVKQHGVVMNLIKTQELAQGKYVQGSLKNINFAHPYGVQTPILISKYTNYMLTVTHTTTIILGSSFCTG